MDGWNGGAIEIQGHKYCDDFVEKSVKRKVAIQGKSNLLRPTIFFYSQIISFYKYVFIIIQFHISFFMSYLYFLIASNILTAIPNNGGNLFIIYQNLALLTL